MVGALLNRGERPSTVPYMSRDALQKLDVVSFTLADHEEGKDGKKKRRRFKMLANTGDSVARMFGKAVFSLEGIEMAKKIPILADHDPTKRVGFADKAELTDEGLELSGFLLSSAAGKQFAEESDEGFPFQASIGLQVSQWLEVEAGDTTEVNGQEFAGPISVAVKSRLLETSVLMAGADHQTHAIALSKEAPMKMTPEEFLAANPEAVAAWKNDADAEARKAQREELGTYLAAFPGRETWAQQQFIKGASLLEAKAALSDVLMEELAAAKAAPLAPPVDPKVAADAEALALLAAKAPGVGFVAATSEPGAKPTLDTLWAEPRIRAEFGGNRNAFRLAALKGLIMEVN